MQVETFECTETAHEPIEACQEAVGLMEELGLEGQKELVTKCEKSGFDQRCPYREMTATEAYVYRVLCPEVTPLKTYKRSPIPLRVLQVAAHANSLGIFKELRVWDRASPAVKDPVLVGVITHPQYDWMDNKFFILARWGEELEAFAVLAKRAFDAKREQFVESLQRIANSIAGRIATAREMSDAELLELGWDAKADLKIGG
jgi:hypothetical protein